MLCSRAAGLSPALTTRSRCCPPAVLTHSSTPLLVQQQPWSRRASQQAATPITTTTHRSPVASAALPLDLDSGATQLLYTQAEGLETPIQLLYLLALLGFLSVGAFLVVRQVLIRRELDESAKGLGERIRTGEASCEDYFELGVILTRKKLFTQATKNLEKAKKVWDGEESELAQVHNALGYCYINMDRTDLAAAEYKRAVALQPGYVTAWNNLGDALEKNKQWREALDAYEEAVSYAPSNQVALQRSAFCKEKIERLGTRSL